MSTLSQPAPAQRYHGLLISLHWLTLLLIIAAYACIELREIYPRGSDPRETLKWLHFNIGLSILLLTLVRLAGRKLTTVPAALPTTPHWQHLVARSVHLLLYLFLLVMPLLGWATRSAEGHALALWGLPLPALGSASESLAETLEEIHETIGSIGYWLIGLHALAALGHHYLRRDDTLRRMWRGPRREL